MKILFIACYIDNSHFMYLMKKNLDKYLINCSYNFICLNDAPDIKNGDENYLNVCDILTGDNNCYEKIIERCKDNNFIHIKIPQKIHIKNRQNHSAFRHRENLNWFNKNINTLFPSYKIYDYICHIDSDCFLSKQIDLNKELKGYDLAGPFIYLDKDIFYIHTGLFFINIKTVKNMININWNDTMGTDTGSDIVNFIKNNPNYKIKKLGHYNGYSKNNLIENGHTIISLNINLIDKEYNLVDKWFNGYFYHFRAGSCFGVGTHKHRNNKRLEKYNKKLEYFNKLFE